MFINTVKSKISIILVMLLAICSLSACSSISSITEANTKISKTGFAFDTVISVTLYGTSDESILDGCMELADYYENLLSATKEGSDIWNINNSDGEKVSVDEETFTLIALAISYADISDGAFNPALGTVINLWDFNSEDAAVPSSQDLEEAMQHTDYKDIILNNEDFTVSLADDQLQVNLGGIAKGYIADQMAGYIKEQGVGSAIINLGGNVYALGSKPDGSNYSVGIQKPFDSTGSAITAVSVSNMSVVTSGTYERYFEQDGELYHHILDPQTGYPTDNNLLSVTILSDNSVDGDALSTTCFVLGLEAGMALIEETPNTEALFITDDYQLHYTSGFPANN